MILMVLPPTGLTTLLAQCAPTASAMATALRAHGCLSKAGLRDHRAVVALLSEAVASVASDPPRPGPSPYDRVAAALLASPFLSDVGRALGRSPPSQTPPLPRREPSGESTGLMLVAGLVLAGVVPLLVYLVNPLGTPPSQEWQTAGSTHGPWHHSLWGWATALGCLMLLGLLLLAPALGVRAYRRTGSWHLLGLGLVLMATAAALLLLYARYALWSLD